MQLVDSITYKIFEEVKTYGTDSQVPSIRNYNHQGIRRSSCYMVNHLNSDI